MNLNELRSVQSKERKKDSLQNLRPSFYQEVGEYIAELEDERERAAERADDPFSSPEVSQLTDEIETAKDVVEAIYERRMGKLVKQASLAAAGMAANDEGLTAEEADLFDDLVERIESNKTRVLDVLEGVADDTAPGGTPREQPRQDEAVDSVHDGESVRESAREHESERARDSVPEETGPEPPEPPAPPQEPPAAGDGETGDGAGVSPADVMGGDGSLGGGATKADAGSSAVSDAGDGERATAATADETAAEGADAADRRATGDDGEAGTTVDRITVKITEDVGAILGVDDREYTLASDDVVTLPEANATPLVEREAAEPLE